MVGLSAAVIVVTIGTIVGLLSGYFGGCVDAVLMRLADIALEHAVPALRDRADAAFLGAEHLEHRARRRPAAVAEHRAGDPKSRC